MSKSINPYTIQLRTSVDALDNEWCVYSLLCADTGETLYVGHNPLKDVFTLSDVRGNVEYKSILRRNRFLLVVLELWTSQLEARSAVWRILSNHPVTPVLNKTASMTRLALVQCDQTGETYKTIKDAAKANSIDQGALSRHLNGRPGHKTVKGMTFSRVLPTTKREVDNNFNKV